MDPSYQYHQQYSTPHPYPPTAATSEAQSYNQPATATATESHYLYHQQYNQAQQYPSYYAPAIHYSNAYQPAQEPAPIHPPGVSVQSDPTPFDYGQTHDPYLQNSYYPQADLEQQQQQQLGYPDPGLQGQHWQGNEVGLIPLYSQPQKCLATRVGLGRRFHEFWTW